MAKEIILPDVRMYWGDLFRLPEKTEDQEGEPKYGGTFIIEPESEAHKRARAAFAETAQEIFGANFAAIVNAMEKSKKCIRKGDEYLDKGGNQRPDFVGKLYIVARNKLKPAIIGPDKRPLSDDGTLYNGCHVNIKVIIQAMKAKGKIPNQVYARLQAVQYARKGDAFGAAPGNAEGFDEVESDLDTDESTATSGASTLDF